MVAAFDLSPRSAPLSKLAASDWTQYAAPIMCALIVVATFTVAHYLIGGSIFPFDDPYIALHNAQVLWSGHDSAYRGVPALIGETSGVHLALLMLFESFIRSDTTALFVLGATGSVAYVLGLYAACINVGCSRLLATLIALSGLIVGGAIFKLLNGLETGLAMAAIAWDIALLIDRKRIVALSILCGLMTFIRPELAFLAIASMAVVFWEHRCSAESVKAVAICALVLLPLLAWYWIDTGSPIPSTIGAKTYFFAQRFLPLRIKLILLIRDLIPALAAVSPLFLCAGFIRPPAVRRILLLFTAVFLASYLWRFPSGFAENDERYLFPFVPIILFSVACGLSSSRRQERAIAISCVVLSLLFVPFGIIHQFRNYREYLTGYRLSLDDTVRWMNRNLPAGSIVMLHDAGYAAYAGHFALVDLAGLKTPAAAEINKHLTYPSAGRLRAEAIAQIAAQFHPGYLLTFHGWDHAFQFANALRDHGWTVRQIYEGRAPVGTPAQDVYVLYQLQPPQ